MLKLENAKTDMDRLPKKLQIQARAGEPLKKARTQHQSFQAGYGSSCGPANFKK